MTAMMVFTDDQIETMRAMRRNGKAWKEIAYRFGCSTATARRHLGLLRNVREYHSVSWRQLNLEPPRPTGFIPERVLADRDRRSEMADQRDLTASFFGDPPKGYSALDRR